MLNKWLRESSYTVVFSGAGMSTESGVPDFRSPNGLWKGKDPQILASTYAMDHNRTEFINFYRLRMELLDGIQPHKGYDILKKWGEMGHLQTVITQNTDGLHEKALNPNVIPIHGTIRSLHCNQCHTKYEVTRYFHNEVICSCGGFIRPSVILFGEGLDTQLLHRAEAEARKAELFIVLGSSLVVSPANSLPLLAKQNGAKLVIINKEETPLDSIADLVVRDRNIGDVLQEVNESVE